jgi:hypothetical protein
MIKQLLTGFLLAAVFWFIMFSPWTASSVNFWYAMILASGTLAVYGLTIGRNDIRDLYRFKIEWVGIGLVSAVLLYVLFFVGDSVSRFLFDFVKPQVSGIYSTKSQASPVFIGTMLLVWIGPAEEIFWRGFAQHRLQKHFGTWKGFLITTAVYAFVHIWAFNFMLFMAALICGLFWGWMFLHYKSVWPGLISHAVWDVTIFVIVPIT